MAGIGGVHAVPDPVLRGRALAGLVKDLLKADQSRAVLLGEPCDDRLAFADVLFTQRAARVSSLGQAEGLAEDEFDGWEGGLGFRQQPVVNLLVLVQRDISSAVVDPDQDAEHIRFEVQRVPLPAGLQVRDGVAADAAVHEGQPAFRIKRAEFRGDDEAVPVPQDMVGVSVAPAVPVSDRIALKQDAGVGLERRHIENLRCRRPCAGQHGTHQPLSENDRHARTLPFHSVRSATPGRLWHTSAYTGGGRMRVILNLKARRCKGGAGRAGVLYGKRRHYTGTCVKS